MKSVLVTGASNIGKAGVATIIYNLIQAMDHSGIQIDYLAQRGIDNEEYRKKIEEKKGQIWEMNNEHPRFVPKKIYMLYWLYKIMKMRCYDIIHINIDVAYLAAVYIFLAKLANIQTIIVHSHSVMIDENRIMVRWIKYLLHKISIRYVCKNSTKKLACSRNAGNWMFGISEAQIIPNGINLEKFQFNSVSRKRYRKELGLLDDLVICTVGRLSFQKNVFFDIDIFEKVLEFRPHSILLMIGDGELKSRLKDYIKKKELTDRVMLLGNRKDISELLSASDIFLLPTRFEGFGLVFMEAQASGMPVFGSDCIPKEVNCTSSLHLCSLQDSPQEWAKKIVEVSDEQRVNNLERLREFGYSITDAANKLKQIYCQ